MQFNEQSICFSYKSKSKTCVEITGWFDRKIIPEWRVDVSIPPERAKPGRNHYERITRMLYSIQDFTIWENDSLALKEDRPDILIPNWVTDTVSNFDPEMDSKLAEKGYTPHDYPFGLKAWKYLDDSWVLALYQGSDMYDRVFFAISKSGRHDFQRRSFSNVLKWIENQQEDEKEEYDYDEECEDDKELE
jgi:hypothetical protein